MVGADALRVANVFFLRYGRGTLVFFLLRSRTRERARASAIINN